MRRFQQDMAACPKHVGPVIRGAWNASQGQGRASKPLKTKATQAEPENTYGSGGRNSARPREGRGKIKDTPATGALSPKLSSDVARPLIQFLLSKIKFGGQTINSNLNFLIRRRHSKLRGTRGVDSHLPGPNTSTRQKNPARDGSKVSPREGPLPRAQNGTTFSACEKVVSVSNRTACFGRTAVPFET